MLNFHCNSWFEILHGTVGKKNSGSMCWFLSLTAGKWHFHLYQKIRLIGNIFRLVWKVNETNFFQWVEKKMQNIIPRFNKKSLLQSVWQIPMQLTLLFCSCYAAVTNHPRPLKSDTLTLCKNQKIEQRTTRPNYIVWTMRAPQSPCLQTAEWLLMKLLSSRYHETPRDTSFHSTQNYHQLAVS